MNTKRRERRARFALVMMPLGAHRSPHEPHNLNLSTRTGGSKRRIPQGRCQKAFSSLAPSSFAVREETPRLKCPHNQFPFFVLHKCRHALMGAFLARCAAHRKAVSQSTLRALAQNTKGCEGKRRGRLQSPHHSRHAIALHQKRKGCAMRCKASNDGALTRKKTNGRVASHCGGAVAQTCPRFLWGGGRGRRH